VDDGVASPVVGHSWEMNATQMGMFVALALVACKDTGKTTQSTKDGTTTTTVSDGKGAAIRMEVDNDDPANCKTKEDCSALAARLGDADPRSHGGWTKACELGEPIA
jgi:hypothetical protein